MNELELTIMNALLDGSGEDLAVLREQAKRSEVAGCEDTGVGFYTRFAVASDAPQLRTLQRRHLGDVLAAVDGVEHGMGFVLWIDHGQLDCLEGYTYDEPLPAHPRLLGWHYLVADGSCRRDLVESAERDVPSVLRGLAG
jgi:hypothetical protein